MADRDFSSPSPKTPHSPFPPRLTTPTSTSTASKSSKRSRSKSSPQSQHHHQQQSPSQTQNPKRHKTTSTSTPETFPKTQDKKKKKRRAHPSFLPVLSHLSTPLHPLVSATTGIAHSNFPTSLLQYHLLTNGQLDSLARHYHQFYPPVPETYQYPMFIRPWVGLHEDVDIGVKRRRFGKFIGLRGCESPILGGDQYGDGQGYREGYVEEGDYEYDYGYGYDGEMDVDVDANVDILATNDGRHGNDTDKDTERQILEEMEREWNRALSRARRDEGERALGRKYGFY